ncbi:hypothetical protein NEPAR06_1388 [Nematocida parisii]|uniref:Uncharacterized protein n=1 Tax=Nematocida parisii (strain ERTm3) TaxID=935791 RepID=I3EKF2_NEMP3|nr:uncharacterized protein NEPG_00766 [Nematocida parisii ERTm1]EIJ89699.1 hypothetical protein NEQG_00469 [Nematocida parisii ERTm3]KAI5126867.1 hypothetical protein NEPAR03_0698 [Nematocida parisii]EIJ94099.1 hypothetical protein NEPG_00766 [Nematocida parisii ERTm1]KAI5126947.1 hypothetical protein NEPAR08_0697 [Nematocida parisii]KAI5141057.1 hypothetical protein NEPAR04_0695 [Nematocida parisii]|eukprot:XP_013058595.1 hypothetical protein NEPG_00766 [Nematocida parisii ERTm1]
MCISDLAGKTCGGLLAIGSAIFILVFGNSYIIFLPIITLHLFTNWYSKKARSFSMKKAITALEVIFSICTIFGYFVISNAVFLLLPGSSALEKVPKSVVCLMYLYFFVYTVYIAHILLGYLDQDIQEEEDSSDIIRYHQMKTLNKQSL